jgi:hypothetical protein
MLCGSHRDIQLRFETSVGIVCVESNTEDKLMAVLAGIPVLFAVYGLYCFMCFVTTWNWFLLEKLAFAQLLQNLPLFYGTQKVIAVFIRGHHWSVSRTRSI